MVQSDREDGYLSPTSSDDASRNIDHSVDGESDSFAAMSECSSSDDGDEVGLEDGSQDGSMTDDSGPVSSRAKIQAAKAHYQALAAVQPAVSTLKPLAPRRNRVEASPWTKKAVVSTRQLYQWFEAQQNDYTSHDFSVCEFINIIWTGHGGDSPRDISGRSFSLEFAPTVSRKDEAALIDKGGAVYRHYFECQGQCVTAAEPDEDEESEEEPPDQEPSNITAKAHAPSKRRDKVCVVCPASVRLLIEIDACDIKKCTIYQRGIHTKASNTKALRYSRRLRLHIMEQGSHAGVTAAQLKKALLNGLDRSADAGGLPREFTRPSWRFPNPKQVDRLVAGLKQASRLHADPFIAVDLFVEANSENVFAYQPLHITKTMKRFSVGVKSSWSIQNLIRWQGKAIYLDSSWRNKNENRAPLTFVTTTNGAGHMVPCAAYLSADATSRTYEHLLKALEGQVVEEAALICSRADAQPASKSSTNVDVLLHNARKICTERAWRPATVMIDKCKAELNAINDVWPDAQVRVCQFHIMQAICRWDTETKSGTYKPPAIARTLKPAICTAFREAQRCRRTSEWPTALKEFEERIKKILCKEPAGTVKQVLNYFSVNWWSPPWHGKLRSR
ncbi:hypothetical protein CF326_g8600 [Tilletia indica]|nr:hypothetical protein CF326_g8600 [Tilletia indica]